MRIRPRREWMSFACVLKCSVRLAMRSDRMAQFRDQRFIALLIDLFDVVEKAAARRNHADQAAARMVVLRVRLEVFGQVGDALRQDGPVSRSALHSASDRSF